MGFEIIYKWLCFYHGDRVVSLKSSKKTFIARSTMKCELIPLYKLEKKQIDFVTFSRTFLARRSNHPLLAYVVIVRRLLEGHKNSMYSGKSRNIRCRHNTIKQLISNGIFSTDQDKSNEEYDKLNEDIVDPLTKELSRDQVYHLLRENDLKAY